MLSYPDISGQVPGFLAGKGYDNNWIKQIYTHETSAKNSREAK
jgi:hypothetical protein